MITSAAHKPADTPRPGATSADVARALPSAHDLGYASEEEAFGLQYCHGVGLSVWEQPLISRYHSLQHPVEIEEGMVFALETYWPTPDGSSAARIEEEVIVTADGARVITRFPADELLVAGTRYWNGFSYNTSTVPTGNAVAPTPAAGNGPTPATTGIA